MNKKILGFMIAGFLLIGLTTAGVVSSWDYRAMSYTEPVEVNKTTQTLCWTCIGNGESNCTEAYESNWDKNDVEGRIASRCDDANAITLDGQTLYGYKNRVSIDEDAIKSYECRDKGNNWSKGVCNERIVVEL